jgi:four helix bundle protein
LAKGQNRAGDRRTGDQVSQENPLEQATFGKPDVVSCGHLLTCHLLKFWNSGMAFLFENLAVYQKALDFSEQIVTLTETFPRGYYFLSDQLNRASVSIATNLAEGNGRFTKNDRTNFFIIARASAQECVPLLELGRRKGFIQDALHSDLRERIEVIAKMISGLINGLEKRRS